MSRSVTRVAIAVVIGLVQFAGPGAPLVAEEAPAAEEEVSGPYFGDGNLPPGCTTETESVYVVFGLSFPRFSDDCYHMRVDLNTLDSPKVDVLLVPPVSPFRERDLRMMRQSIEMWEAGIAYLSRRMGLSWLADGVEFNVFIGHPDDEVDTDPLWFPKIVVVSSNPAGGAGIGIDPNWLVFGKSGPCHGIPNPLASFSAWRALPGFDTHHGDLSGTYTTQCEDGGSVCFAVNAAIEPLPGLVDETAIFNLYDLVSHEVGHCLSVGHVGDAGDHVARAVPVADIMSYTPRAHYKCVSTLDVEAFALRLSRLLLDEPLVGNHNTDEPLGKFQIQHPDDHRYASSSGEAEDCPQPDDGLVPGDRVSFDPE